GVAERGRGHEGLVILALLGRWTERVVRRPARGLVPGLAARELPRELLLRLRRPLRALVEAIPALDPVARAVQVVRVERLRRLLDRVRAECGRAAGPDAAGDVGDLGRIGRVPVAGELAAIAHEGLPLARGEVVVVVEVDGGREHAVEGAAGDDEGIRDG